jgi:hypothetical protein
MLASGAYGAAKVDIALRSIASTSDDGVPVGAVPPELSWEMLHDLVRPSDFYADTTLKRRWVSDKLAMLEALGLVERKLVPGGRSRLIVLRDDGSGATFDDPTGEAPDSYVSFLGSLLATGRFSRWKAPELATYFAAMIAERYARADKKFSDAVQLERLPLGGGLWYRPLTWFADLENERPSNHIRIPFSERTLRRGVKALKREGLMWSQRIQRDPRTGVPFKHGWRVMYFNGFDDVRYRVRQRPILATMYATARVPAA